MSSSKPESIAIFDAIIITIIATVLYVIISFLTGIKNFQPLFVFVPAVYVSTYLIIKYSINRFIYEKIKEIYKTIGKQKVESRKSKTRSHDDVLEIVNQAVLEWSEEQKKEVAELKETAKYRREFIGNVSHELKTPIFNIQGYILTLLDGGLKDDEINIKFLQKAKKSVNRMIAIVEDLEEISKFESGVLKLHTEVFDLNELTQDVMEYMEIKAQDYNSKIILETPHNHNYQVVADKRRVRQVLINLIDNAIKYGDPEKGVVAISIYDFHDYFLTEISDNGMGIPEDILFRVFERFFRTDQARLRQTKGTGLGLAIVKHIIEAHNQKISVRNNPDKGSTFSFSLKKAK
jgi:two-component system, OmpR family, phosphate regulon sensor histidine kinase PhoR